MSEEVLYLKKEITKIRNSKKKYIEIPDEFFELSHGDVTERIVRNDDDVELSVIFVFNKRELKKTKKIRGNKDGK